MTRRYYQLFALLILFGAPLLVSLAVNGLAVFQPTAAGVPATGTAAQPDYAQQTVNPADNLPPALPPPPEAQPQGSPQAGAAFSPAPSLDPAGMSVAGTDPTPGAGGGSDPPPAATEQADGGYGAPGSSGEEAPTAGGQDR